MEIPRSVKPKVQLRMTDGYKKINKLISKNHLNTVCEEARCPNIYDCWERGTATIMILGDTCTRACGFCSVKTGKPSETDFGEPIRVGEAVKKMGLRHVVLTSVDRDDIKHDFGASIWANTIQAIREISPKCTIEVLTPDFQGYLPALIKVFDAKPDIFSHNVECVERISKQVRAQANWERSLQVLNESVKYGLLTKSGVMVGLGESDSEVYETMEQVADLGVKIFTIGQYLQPTKDHITVKRYVEEENFQMYKAEGLKMGFDIIESGSLVRSSYHADEQAAIILKD
jgi:lipoic acid synthetase